VKTAELVAMEFKKVLALRRTPSRTMREGTGQMHQCFEQVIAGGTTPVQADAGVCKQCETLGAGVILRLYGRRRYPAGYDIGFTGPNRMRLSSPSMHPAVPGTQEHFY
jgi:hypothetical protein